MYHIKVDDQPTEIYVYCDGYYLLFRKGGDTNILTVFINAANVCDLAGNQVIDSGGNYRMSRDSSKAVDIIEKSPHRVKIRVHGQMKLADQQVLTNNVSATGLYTIYADRMMYESFLVFSDSVEFDVNKHSLYYCWHAGAAGYDLYYENSGSETDEAGGANFRDSAKYFLGTRADSNFITIFTDLIYPAGGGVIRQFASDTSGVANAECLIDMNATGPEVVAGTYSIRVMTIIDTTYRVGSAKKYTTLASRIALADQYNDTILDQSPLKGDDVTTMILPARVGSGTMHGDAAHYYESNATPALKLTLDRDREELVIVIRNWGTEYLLCYLKCNENAASANLIDQTGNDDATWCNISDGSDRNTNTAGDSVQEIGEGGNLDTQDGSGFIEMAVGAGTVHDNDFYKKGSVLIKFMPQFSYDVADYEVIWELNVGTDDQRINFHYDYTTDTFDFHVDYGTSVHCNSQETIANNFHLQTAIVALCSWDSEKDFMMLSIDGQVQEVKNGLGSPSATEPSKFYIGSDDVLGTFESDIIIDEVKTFSEAILPYGANFIGNGGGLLADIKNPNINLSWYFDGQAELAKGGTALATTKNPTNTGGQFVTTDPLIGTNHWDSNGTGNVLTISDSSEDIVDYNKGFVAIWFNVQSALSGGEYLIDVRDADGSDRISAVFDASGNIDVTYRSNSTDEVIVGDIAITVNKWNYLKIIWDDTDKVHSYINGIENGTPQDIASVWGGGSGLIWYFTEDYNNANGVDAFIGNIIMGKESETPEIWTAFGVPLDVPLPVFI